VIQWRNFLHLGIPAVNYRVYERPAVGPNPAPDGSITNPTILFLWGSF